MATARVYRTISITVFIIAILHAETLAQEIIRKRGERPERGLKDSPLATFKGIEKAWIGEDASALSHFVGDGKVFVSIRGIGQKGGYFSRPQVHYLFKRMFKNFEHMKFDFVKYHNLDDPERRVYGIAYRTYRNRRNGQIIQDKVYVTLRKEGDGWAVGEIKATK